MSRSNWQLLLGCLVATLFAAPASSEETTSRVVAVAYYPSYKFFRVHINPFGELGVLDERLTRTPDGEPGLKGEYFSNRNFEGAPALVRTDRRVDFKWYWGSPGQGVPVDGFAVRWTGTVGPIPEGGACELVTTSDDGVRMWLDGEQVIDDWNNHPATTNVARKPLQPGRTYDLRLEYFEGGGTASCRLGRRIPAERAANIKAALVTLHGPDGAELLRETMRWDGESGERQFDVPDLPDGTYTVKVELEGFPGAIERRFERIHFPWEGNRLGITDKVYPPFEPVRVENGLVSVVLRNYRLTGLGLFNQVESLGRELLAAPITLRVNQGEELQGQGGFIETKPAAAVYEGSSKHPAVSVKTRCTIEYDGCMKVELELLPGQQKQQLRKLWIDIPLKDEEVPLWHVCTAGLRSNPAGATPEGNGVVWDSTQFRAGYWGGPSAGNFKPYIWLGAEERGLCWFADNDRGWVLDLQQEAEAPCLELSRTQGVVTLRVNLVQKPITIEKPRRIVFGLMASPGKPMPEDWRRVLANRRQEGYLNHQLMGSQYWGSTQHVSMKYPVNGDLSILSKMQECRLAGRVPAWQEFKKQWADRNLVRDMSDRGSKTYEAILKLVDYSLLRSARRPYYFTAYWEVFDSTSWYHPESRVFINEWWGRYADGPRSNWSELNIGCGGIVPSYQDFACWWGAEFIRRGIGLYFDNAFPMPAYDTLTTSAYKLPDGFVQPSAGMWARREYLRRMWVLHQQLAPAETKPLMMLHMTNTHIVPYMVFNECNLDLEWKYGPHPLQTRYPADLLRAESIGLQTGNIPEALANIHNTTSDEQKAFVERTRFGVLMVHEIKAYMPGEDGKLLTRVLDFGYGRDGCKVFNYWDEAYPVRSSDPDCKSLLLQRGNELLLVLCTWNADPETVTLSLDTDTLGMTPTAAADAESGKALEMRGATLSVPLEGYGVRLVKLTK